MSKIEKALEKSKKEREADKSRTSIPVRDDTVQSNIHNKDASIHNLKSSTKSKSEENVSHITSAIEKKDNENSTVHSPLITKDYHQLVDDSGLISQVQDTGRENKKAESVIPSKTIDKYEVEEHIVSYYESIGQQPWIGPVMVNFRRLHVSLTNMQKNKIYKVMLFTSATQNEGKSTIALNTAIMLSSDNKSKVAIVDCDFRKPTVSTMLGFSPEIGLPDYLSEKAEIKDISLNGLTPGLTIIPVGKKPPNTCELFASDRMKQFVSYLKKRFDYVIIDSPPILAFPDSAILAPLSDGVVFIINNKKTKKSLVKRAVEMLHDCKIIGFIMNRSNVVANDYYGYSSRGYNYDDTRS